MRAEFNPGTVTLTWTPPTGAVSVTLTRALSWPASISQGRHLVQAALRQGQVYARRRTWCSNCGRYAGRLDTEGQCERCAAWWRANPLPVEAQAGQEEG